MRRVMVIEDDPLLADLMTDFLETLGHEIVLAETGAEALGKMDPAPDLITVDHRLPDMLGLDLLIQLRDHPIAKNIPKIFLSADAKLHESEARARGATAVLTKPVSLTQLDDTLKKCWQTL